MKGAYREMNRRTDPIPMSVCNQQRPLRPIPEYGDRSYPCCPFRGNEADGTWGYVDLHPQTECQSQWERRAVDDDLETASLALLSMRTGRELSLTVKSGKGGRCEAEEGLPNREIEAWKPQR